MLYLDKLRRKRSDLPPGPVGIPIIGSLPFLDPELHKYFLRLAKKHGPTFSLWFGSKLTVVVSSPSIAKEVLKDNDVIFVNHDVPATARAATYGGIDIAWLPYGPEWRILRYLYGKLGSPVNIAEQMFLNTFNVVTSMPWGGTLREEERATLGVELKEIMLELMSLLGAPNILDFFPALTGFDL
ncbi:Sugiol synthase-like protein [Drosera capensis]